MRLAWFLLAALLWHVVEEEAASMMANGVPSADAINLAGDAVISQQIARIAMPRRFTNVTREIWALQLRLQRPSRRSDRLLEHPRFRAAYDFLCGRRVLVRHFPSHALTAPFLRITVGTDPEMRVLSESLDAWLSKRSA